MLKTGNNFTDYFFLATTFLPLIPAILIFLQKNYGKEPLNLLLIVCIFNFIDGFTRHVPMSDFDNQYVTKNVFSLLEMILLTQLFASILTGRTKTILNIFLVVFLSVYLTFFSIKGWQLNSKVFDSLQSCIIMGVALLSLPPLIRTANLHIFQSALFWIAGGTLFYFFLSALLEWIVFCCLPLSRIPNEEKMIFMTIADLVRYSFYTLAVLLYRFPGRMESESPS
jgi:hypothetical protein